ncbi:RNA polymerase sigma factor, partial [Prevotella sp.]|uniref:RNA polymerase sigma factor n=1 Tax=Prevotella sp. TaxID=59823 RepID=UPI001CB16146
EALIKAYLRSSQYAERGLFSAWLMKIAYRVFIDSHRKQKQQQELPLEKAITLQGNSKSDDAFRYQELHTALATLSETMRTSILLYYMQGYQIKEIAEITENSEDAIKKQLSRGRQELKHILER